jgi:hypothetical protein
LKKGLLKAMVKLNIHDAFTTKAAGLRVVAEHLSLDPIWKPFAPITDKKILAAYQRLMKQIGTEVVMGNLNPAPDQPALPKFLKYALLLLSKEKSKCRNSFLSASEMGTAKPSEDGFEEEATEQPTAELEDFSGTAAEGVERPVAPSTTSHLIVYFN